MTSNQGEKGAEKNMSDVPGKMTENILEGNLLFRQALKKLAGSFEPEVASSFILFAARAKLVTTR